MRWFLGGYVYQLNAVVSKPIALGSEYQTGSLPLVFGEGK
jgi:hypothetical protein